MNNYEINVAYKGFHLFTTHVKSLYDLKILHNIIKYKFPESEEFKITVTKWETIGHKIETKELI